MWIWTGISWCTSLLDIDAGFHPLFFIPKRISDKNTKRIQDIFPNVHDFILPMKEIVFTELQQITCWPIKLGERQQIKLTMQGIQSLEGEREVMSTSSEGDFDVKRLECYFWASQGVCKWGTKCRYAHKPTGKVAKMPQPAGNGELYAEDIEANADESKAGLLLGGTPYLNVLFFANGKVLISTMNPRMNPRQPLANIIITRIRTIQKQH